MKNSIPKNRILLRGAALALALCLLFSCAACGKKNTLPCLPYLSSQGRGCA